MLSLYALVASMVACLLVGGLIVLSNLRDVKIRLYGVLTVLLIVMSIANYLAIESAENQLVYVRAVMFSSTLAIYFIYLLVLYLKTRAHRIPPYADWVLYATLVTAALDWTDIVFLGVIPGKPPTPILGAGVVIYFAHFAITLALSIRLLYRDISSNSTVKERRQYRLLMIGTVPVLLLAPITSFILPNFFGIGQFVALTPLYAFIFVVSVGYAIVRHGLFDVRFAAVRTVAYGLSVIVLALVYYFFAYIVSMTFFQGQVTSAFSISPLNIALALALAFIFQPIKNFFDRITDTIFFRDRYSSSDFYQRLSSLLGSTTDLRGLLYRAATEISTTLKAEQALFYVWQDEHKVSTGTKKHARLPEEDIRLLRTTQPSGVVDGIIVAELLPEDDNVRRMLVSHHFAIALPLRQDSQTIGYLLLGNHQAAKYTTRDVKVLATIADELTIAIHNALSVQAVKDINATLEQRIEKATEELRRTNARLRRLDQAKDEFLSMASHQLRTPLTSVKGYISMMLEGDTGKTTPMQKKVLNEAFSSSERMVHLIHDFLNVSRLQTGKFMLELADVDLVTLVSEEVKGLQGVADARNMKLDFQNHTHDLPLLLLDDTKMRQVVMNYIDNAIYYSQPDTTITVELSTTNDEVILKVIDTGIGVPKSEQARLFEKFYRASNARRQRPDGTGVGIFLAKRVVEAQGGEVVFSSKEGKGSIFGFRLPLKQDVKELLKNSAQQLKK